jgi:hypothetical protein
MCDTPIMLWNGVEVVVSREPMGGRRAVAVRAVGVRSES